MYGVFFEGHPDLCVFFLLLFFSCSAWAKKAYPCQATYLDRLWFRGPPSAERLPSYRTCNFLFFLFYSNTPLTLPLHRVTPRSDTMTKRSGSSTNPFNSPRRLETLTMPPRHGSRSVVVTPRPSPRSTTFLRPQSPRRRRRSRFRGAGLGCATDAWVFSSRLHCVVEGGR